MNATRLSKRRFLQIIAAAGVAWVGLCAGLAALYSLWYTQPANTADEISYKFGWVMAFGCVASTLLMLLPLTGLIVLGVWGSRPRPTPAPR